MARGYPGEAAPSFGLDTFEFSLPNFFKDALCAEVSPEFFYAEHGKPSPEAKECCGLCGIREKCLQFALDSDEPHGMWGGLTPKARKRLKRAELSRSRLREMGIA